MLASKYTLKGEKSFERVKEEGKLYRKPLFGFVVYDRKDDETSRFGVTVSKKVSKMASQRNRIKRAITEAVRHEMNYIKNGYDVVILVNKKCAKASTEEIMNQVKSTISDLDLLK